MANESRAAQKEGIKPEELANVKPLEAPWFYASAFRVIGTGNDFQLIFQRASPSQNPDGSLNPEVAHVITVAAVTMSPQAIKDLYVLLGGQIEAHEKEFGTIETPFVKSRATRNAKGRTEDEA